jgi:hypothetical protein
VALSHNTRECNDLSTEVFGRQEAIETRLLFYETVTNSHELQRTKNAATSAYMMLRHVLLPFVMQCVIKFRQFGFHNDPEQAVLTSDH